MKASYDKHLNKPRINIIINLTQQENKMKRYSKWTLTNSKPKHSSQSTWNPLLSIHKNIWSNAAVHQDFWGWDQDNKRGGGWTAPTRLSSAGARAGTGNCQLVERPLVSAQKGTQKKTNYQKTPRYNPPRYRQGPGHMLRPEVGGGKAKAFITINMKSFALNS